MDSSRRSIGEVLASMLYATHPKEAFFEDERLLLVRGFGVVEALHVSAREVSFARVMKEQGAAEGDTHRRSLLDAERLSAAWGAMELRASSPHEEITRVRFERRAVTVASADITHRMGVPTPELVIDALCAATPGLAMLDVKRPRREILKDALYLSVLSLIVGGLTIALGNLLQSIEWLAHLAPYVIDGGGVIVALLLIVCLIGTALRLIKPEALVELRPREAAAPYRS